jgi:hypothetical protein
MPGEMERALDEILSGVNALLEQAPSTAATAPRTAGRLARASVPPEGGVTVDAGRLSGLLSVLACVASDPQHPACLTASESIRQLLVQRSVALGEIGGDFDDVAVSPLLHRPLRGLWQIGSVLVDCNAEFMMWEVATADLARARALMGRWMASVCPDQGDPVMRWRIPRYPERLRVKWTDGYRAPSVSMSVADSGVGLIDHDNIALPIATIFWSRGALFVPDWFCGMAHHAGQWRPVVASDAPVSARR